MHMATHFWKRIRSWTSWMRQGKPVPTYLFSRAQRWSWTSNTFLEALVSDFLKRYTKKIQVKLGHRSERVRDGLTDSSSCMLARATWAWTVLMSSSLCWGERSFSWFGSILIHNVSKLNDEVKYWKAHRFVYGSSFKRNKYRQSRNLKKGYLRGCLVNNNDIVVHKLSVTRMSNYLIILSASSTQVRIDQWSTAMESRNLSKPKLLQ